MNGGPIFIGGCDRSGTTMLGDILGRADQAFATPESQFLHELALLLHQRAFSSADEAARWMACHFRFATWELELSIDELARILDIRDPRRSIDAVLAAFKRQHGHEPSSRWVDHTPDNMRYHALMKAIYPEARYIHLVRDGRAVYQSIRNLSWGPNNAYSASRYWCQRIEQALLVEAAEGDNCRRQRFEDILLDPRGSISVLCNWLELSYSDDMLDGGSVPLPGFTRGQHQLVGQRPCPSRVERWREVLTPRQIAVFEAYPLSRVHLQAFGYALDHPLPVRVPAWQAIGHYLHDGLCYGLNRIRHRLMEHRTVATYKQAVQPPGHRPR